MRNLSVAKRHGRKGLNYFGKGEGKGFEDIMETLREQVHSLSEEEEAECGKEKTYGQSCSGDDKHNESKNDLSPSEPVSQTNSKASQTDSEEDEDVHYICTIAKTSIPVSVIRLAPPRSSETNRHNIINQKSVDVDVDHESDSTPNCGASMDSSSPSSVSSGSKTHASNDEIRIQCNLCDKKFTQQRNYNYHMAQHNGSQLYACTCPICGKSYRNKGYLSNHLKIHRNAKEYRCEWCSRSFNQRVAYNTHIRVHTGYCPHKCPLCDKAFSRKTVLTSHIRTHTGEKPFKCGMCDKAFVDKSNMLTHQRLHTGEKPFRCHICGKSFTQRNHLKTHINYHVGIKPYHCHKCGARFSQSSNLKMHSTKCTGILRAGSSSPQESISFIRITPVSAGNCAENAKFQPHHNFARDDKFEEVESRTSILRQQDSDSPMESENDQNPSSMSPSENSDINAICQDAQEHRYRDSCRSWSTSLLAQRLLGK